MATSRALASALALVAVAHRAAFATTAGDLCPATADPCTVAASVRVDPSSDIDLGTRALHVRPGGSLAVGSGLMTIHCGSLLVQPGGTLTAQARTGGSVSVVATGDIRVATSTAAQGRIDVSSATDPGGITLAAGGKIEIDGVLTADATSVEGDGGSISLSAGDGVVVTGRVGAAGGGDGGGGVAKIDAQHDVTVGGRIDASGGETDGGSIEVEAGGSLVGGASETIDVSGGGLSGSGGDVTLLAHGATLAIGGEVLGQAGGSADEGGGDGGSLTASALGGTLRVDGKVLMPGAVPDGGGGDAELEAAGSLVVSGSIMASGAGSGGVVQLSAPALSVGGEVEANGGGGTLVLAACAVMVPSGAHLATEGPAGLTRIEASGPMTIAAALVSGPPGTNELDYADPTSPPALAGSAIRPAPQVVLKSALPVPCRVAVCGDGVVDPGEQCDDGAANGTAGDPCSVRCTEVPEALGPAGPVEGGCGVGWAVEGASGPTAKRQRATVRCLDGDPSCDFEPSLGTCRFHVWACADADDRGIPCPGGPVTRVRVRGGRGTKQSAAGADRRSLQAALAALPLPVATGQACTPRIDINVPFGRPLTLRTAAHAVRGNVLRQALRLRCIDRSSAASFAHSGP